ncbi:MAG: hypothetical protein GY786_21965 [Proteobacteria bacterium]|nr:hypothetical protein [Pseudomonadota bacterium]
MYTSKEDIEKISVLMRDIQEGKISRNKNYYTLAKSKEYSRFKRAKLLISLLEDLEKTRGVDCHEISIDSREGNPEVFLYNPILKYTRKVILSDAELTLIQSQTQVALIG